MSTLAQRNALYARLEEVLGPEHADTLMTHMPTETDLVTRVDLSTLSERLAARFDGIDARFDGTDARFEAIDARFDGIDARFDAIDARFEAIDSRFGGIDARLEQVDSRFDRLESHMVRFDTKLDGFHAALRDQSRTYVLTMTGVMASFAAVVVATGILN